VGYVEEDDQEGEEGTEEAHHHQQAQFTDVRQRAQAQPSRPSAHQACKARHARYLHTKFVVPYNMESSKSLKENNIHIRILRWQICNIVSLGLFHENAVFVPLLRIRAQIIKNFKGTPISEWD
jgi:hypothetical protein